VGKANLNAIIQLLDEENIARVVSIRHDLAREQYSMKKAVVQSFDEFKAEVTRFYQYQYCITITGSTNVVVPEWMASGFAIDILERAFSKDGGLEGAYRIAQKGVQGGMRAILDAIYKILKAQQEEQYIDYVLRSHVDPLDWNDKVDLMTQYLQRFGRNLPAGAQVKSAMELAIRYEDFLKLHMKALQTIRSRIAP